MFCFLASPINGPMKRLPEADRKIKIETRS